MSSSGRQTIALRARAIRARDRGAPSADRKAPRREGMTLIEIMIVVVILAVVATGITFSLGAIARTNLRSGCMKILAASRYAYSRSISQGTTVRVVLDADNGTLSIEEAHGRVVLARSGDPLREASEEAGEEGAAVDPWEAARQRLEKTMQPTFGASPFAPIRGRNGEELEMYKARPIAPGVRIARMYLPHEPEPRERGRGAIYFFPGGRTENAVVWLSDSSDRVYSVELHPLTGRGKVRNEAYEPDPRDLEEDEVEDPS